MNRITAVVAGLLLAFVGTSASLAATINVPGDYTSIQDAINASSNGDVINIAAGTYHEYNLDPNGKAITIQGSPNSNTTIDAQGQYHAGGGVFVIKSGEGDDTVIKDLVITGGNTILGGGIRFSNSVSPTIQGCTISGNTSGNLGLGGGGLYCGSWSSPTITGCTISNNTSAGNYFGGGIYCDAESSPNIINCTISANSASNGGGVWYYNSDATITDCTISGNTASYGGGIGFSGDSNPTITGCTISGNTANSSGGGIYCISTSNPTINGSDVCGNLPDQINGNFNTTDGGNVIATSCPPPPLPTGACCLGGTCITATESDCTTAGGTYAGDDVACADAGCATPPVTGACCVSSGCVINIIDNCDDLGGTWLGEDGSCYDCAPTCQGDVNADGVVDVFDLLKVIDGWGICD